MAASVVDFPLPVGPVISTRPLDFMLRVLTTSGRPSSSRRGIVNGMGRKERAIVPRCREAFTRNRPAPGKLYDRSSSYSRAKVSR